MERPLSGAPEAHRELERKRGRLGDRLYVHGVGNVLTTRPSGPNRRRSREQSQRVACVSRVAISEHDFANGMVRASQTHAGAETVPCPPQVESKPGYRNVRGTPSEAEI